MQGWGVVKPEFRLRSGNIDVNINKKAAVCNLAVLKAIWLHGQGDRTISSRRGGCDRTEILGAVSQLFGQMAFGRSGLAAVCG